jgi:predicted MFS family arabinose efflux permease
MADAPGAGSGSGGGRRPPLRPVAFVAVLSFGHVLTMLGFSAFPALLPLFTELWGLSSIEGGMVNSAFFLGYTLAVPVLVSITDRVDARRIYVASAVLGVAANLGFALLARDAPSAAAFTALYGVSLAGTYMPGLRVLGEHIPPTMVARATAYYTSSFGTGAAISYVLSDWLAERFDWPAPFLAAAAASLLAVLLVLSVTPPLRPPATGRSWIAVIDPRPVFRNRSAMAYSICYGLHSFELFTVRSWVVAFLAAAALRQGAEPVVFTPALVAALLTLLGVFASIAGSEVAIRGGRRRTIAWAMVISALLAFAAGSASALAYWLTVVLVVAHGIAIMADSAALTAGAFGSARPGSAASPWRSIPRSASAAPSSGRSCSAASSMWPAATGSAGAWPTPTWASSCCSAPSSSGASGPGRCRGTGGRIERLFARPVMARLKAGHPVITRGDVSTGSPGLAFARRRMRSRGHGAPASTGTGSSRRETAAGGRLHRPVRRSRRRGTGLARRA